MTEFSLNTSMFPQLASGVRAQWAPVFFEPIAGSYERFVVGVAAFNDQGFHLETANGLDRLKCFYGADAIGAISAIQIAAEYLADDLAKRSFAAITDSKPAVTGISFGDIREAEGQSLKSVAQSWMTALSSLYLLDDSQTARDLEIPDVPSEIEMAGDRLPFRVCDYVLSKKVGFARYFSEDLRKNLKTRAKKRNQEPVIDFSGSRLVANLVTLKVSSLPRSFDLVKLRLWDLNTVQVREQDSSVKRVYEMILQRPPENDPQVSDKQHNKLEDALKELVEQADEKSLRLRPLDSFQQIGEYILKAEAA